MIYVFLFNPHLATRRLNSHLAVTLVIVLLTEWLRSRIHVRLLMMKLIVTMKFI